MRKYLVKKITILVGVILLGFTFSSFKGDDKNFQIAKNLDIFNSIFKELNMLYVDTIMPDKSVKVGIDSYA